MTDEWNKKFSTSLEDNETAAADFLDKWKEKFNGNMENWKTTADDTHTDLIKKAQVILNDLDNYEAQVENLVGIISNTSMSGAD